jgi:serine beta-lactamase-like protein LACTB
MNTILRWLRVPAAALACAALSRPMVLRAQDSAAAEAARDLVQDFMAANLVPGLAVAVGVDADVVWSEGFGYADLADSTPVTTATAFRIGSISMPLTAAGIAVLMEQGKLNLRANICYYVPSFPEKPYVVTVRQLAGHLGGIRHYRGDEFYNTRHYSSVLEGITMFARDSLLFEPGTRYSFSSFGWNLLSAAIESAAGEDFLTFMQHAVFDPLGLRHTVPDRVDGPLGSHSRWYQLASDSSSVVEAPTVDNSYKWAGGGFLSTPEDLVRFGLAQLNPGYLERRTVERLWTSQRTNDGIETGYGVGWSVGRDGEGRRVVSHTGSSVGGRAILLVYPDDKVVVAIAANLSGVAFRNLPQEIARLFLR